MLNVNSSTLLNILSLSVPTLSLYIIWFNRKNIYAHLGVPSLLIAYAGPLIFYNEAYSKYEVYSLYTKINIIGAISFLIGALIAKKTPIINLPLTPFYNIQRSYLNVKDNIKKRTFFILLFSCFLVAISYIAMGFTPMFSSDPLAAKFFRGDYQETYQRVAVFFRTGMSIIPIFLPLAILLIKEKFSYRLLFVVLFGFICIALSLQRGLIGFSILIPALIYFSYKTRFIFLLVFFMYIFIYVFGAALWWLLGFAYSNVDSFLEGAMAGSPDVPDQLSFLSRFILDHSFTYGRTFIGGLIPFGYEWNPSVYTLKVLNGVDDISEIISGGLRLPVYMWGYVSFSWPGVIGVSFISGYLTTHMILFIKKSSSLAIPLFTLNYIYATTILLFIVNFYNMSIYSIPNLFFVFIFYYFVNWKLKVNKKLNSNRGTS
ncbi:O-antigen polymerase [Xenorhabdus entomophaga]|uniref:O-antigen polymerase n=1 Tax=Xenorhabdus entomophaga TaxID=3136257 RepID=UPI0030F39A5A